MTENETKPPKKRKFWKWVIGIILLIILVNMCSGDDAEEDAADAEPEVQEEDIAEEPEEDVEEEIDEITDDAEDDLEDIADESPDLDQGWLEEQALLILQDNFSGSANVDFQSNSGTYTIEPTDDLFVIELLEIVDGQRGVEDWYGMVDSLKGLSESMEGLLGPGYTISLMNPANTENTLLMVMDGVVIYDVFQD